MAIIPCNQLSLADVFSDCQDIYESDKPEFLSLLQSNIDLDEITPDSLLLVFLNYSRHLREFCGFDKVPDASKITRFKQDFIDDLQVVFERLVDVTEPICQNIDAAKASMTIFDTSGMEAWVTENNPKYLNKIIKQLKAYTKNPLNTRHTRYMTRMDFTGLECIFSFISHLPDCYKAHGKNNN